MHRPWQRTLTIAFVLALAPLTLGLTSAVPDLGGAVPDLGVLGTGAQTTDGKAPDDGARFTCRATALRALGAEPWVANPDGDPCQPDEAALVGGEQAEAEGIEISVLFAETELEPDDATAFDADAAEAGAGVAVVEIDLDGTEIVAELLVAEAEATCEDDMPVLDGESSVASLTINDEIVNVDGHTDVPLVVGTLHLNEQIDEGDRLTQRALWLEGPTEIVVSEAIADVHGNPCEPVVDDDADVRIAKADDPDPVEVDENLDYTLDVTNDGPGTAQSVTVTDTLPHGVEFRSADSDPGDCPTTPDKDTITGAGNDTVVCELGDLAPGESGVVEIRVRPQDGQQGTTLTNVAEVAAATDDPELDNNEATEMTTVADDEQPPPPPPPEPCPDADVDPRGPGNPHPDDCEFSAPQGEGEDNIHIRRHMPDADESPNGAYTPASNPDTREEFNMDVGFLEDDSTQPELKDDDELYDDEDMGFRFLLETIDAYLAPDDDPDSRWRRFCGTGVIEALDDEAPDHFADGAAHPYLIEAFDAELHGDSSGGNNDWFVISIFGEDSDFDTANCDPAPPGAGSDHSHPDIDYHAEGQIDGGNISIDTERGTSD